MKLIVPMSGLGTRFLAAGHSLPKPLIPVSEKPMIAHLLEQFPKAWPKVFICNSEHLDTTDLRGTLLSLAPGARVLSLPTHKSGPVGAVVQALEFAPDILADEEPCLVNYCDFNFSWKPSAFEQFVAKTKCDGCVLGYTGFHAAYIRPTLYAYCRHDGDRLLEIKEKGHFTPDRTSEFASSGSYYFRTGAVVREYFTRLMNEGPLLGGEGYVSVIFSRMLEDDRDVRIFPIQRFDQWGTPEDLDDYHYWEGVKSAPRNRGRPRADLQLLMPMAGAGSRFSESAVPKPFLPMEGDIPMFRLAVEHLPCADKRVFVILKDHRAYVTANEGDVFLSTTPTEGQAVTCLVAESNLDPEKPVIVSSCDHGLVWNEEKWDRLLSESPDVVVWGQRNYPMSSVTPNAFSYIQVDENSDRVKSVSVKRPLGNSPRRELLLVGTFYFHRADLLFSSIRELCERNERVNNELYLDSVVNLLIARGADVRVFESSGYLCWGTPESLREFNYWMSCNG